VNEAAPQLPRIRVVSPSQSCGAHAAIARDLSERMTRDFAQLPREVRERILHDAAVERAFQHFMATLRAKVGLAP